MELPLKKGNKQKKAFVSSVYACVASERYIAKKIGIPLPEGPKSDKWEFFKFAFLIKKKKQYKDEKENALIIRYGRLSLQFDVQLFASIRTTGIVANFY